MIVSWVLNGYDDVLQEICVWVEVEVQCWGYCFNIFVCCLKMGIIDVVGFVFFVCFVLFNNNVFFEMVGEISYELVCYDIDLLLIVDDEQVDKYGYMCMVQGCCVDVLIVVYILDDDLWLVQLQVFGFLFLVFGCSCLVQFYVWFDFDNYVGICCVICYLI